MTDSKSMRFNGIVFFLIVFFLFTSKVRAVDINNRHVDIIVSKDGSGDFNSLTEAIASLPMYNYERTVIYIKNGIYNEKIRIECDYVTLVGESSDSTIIQYNQLREDWLKEPDFIGPAVINIHADDIILENLTVKNTQPQIGPHAFTIYGEGTRTIIYKCNVISNGGDTVSLWNYKHGMYYHSDCYFEGAVDFVCPRGWCYIDNSSFYENSKTAAIWHAAVLDSNQKFVIKNSKFDGVDGYSLGRHHYEAQFYLLNCEFSKNMADKPISRVVYKDRPEKNRPYFYGDRYFYSGCKGNGVNFKWYKDNLKEWPDNVTPDKINSAWTFDNKWNPEETNSIKTLKLDYKDKDLNIIFSDIVAVRGELKIKTNTGKILTYVMGAGRDRLKFKSNTKLSPKDISETLEIVSGKIYAVKAYVVENILADKILIP